MSSASSKPKDKAKVLARNHSQIIQIEDLFKIIYVL